MRSGKLEPTTKSKPVSTPGNLGVYWSSRAYSTSNNVYDLVFNEGANYPAGTLYARSVGRSLRCLSTDGEVRSGYATLNFHVDLSGGSGPESRYWSSLAGDDTERLYNFGFNSSGVYPSMQSNYLHRNAGFSLRCLSTDGEVRSGGFWLDDGTVGGPHLGGLGGNGYYWGSTLPESYPYYLGIYSVSISPAISGNKHYHGIPLRCLSTDGEGWKKVVDLNFFEKSHLNSLIYLCY